MPQRSEADPDTRHPAVRAAILAYRRRRREGGGDLPAFEAACAAWSGHAPLDKVGVHDAIHFATMMDPVWFWSGVPAEWDWPRLRPGGKG